MGMSDNEKCAEDIFPTKKQEKPDFDPVHRPEHYNKNGIECIDAIEASMTRDEFLGYLKGSIIKYLWRYRYKNNPQQDLDKAEWYSDKLSKTYSKEYLRETQNAKA